LDNDFDLLMDTKHIHILRPSSFEFIGKLQEAIMAAAPENATKNRKDLPFIDFDTVEEYACKHPRAARYLASIRAQGKSKNIDKKRLKVLCRDTSVVFTEAGGKLVIDQKNVMGFLEVLDRRRYKLELVAGSPEKYRAASRSELNADGNDV
jgi:hypothetical protein